MVPAEDAVTVPEPLSDSEAATLPIAGLTAWSTLQEGHIKPGDWVLVEGTGGVAIFALQFAKLAGARVAAISSSDEKLARVRELGADATVNYRTTPEWGPAVREATGGRGVDIVVETGGAATLPQALTATAFGGFVGIVGFVGGFEAKVDVRRLLGPMIRVQGIAVGSRARFEAMNRAIAAHGLRPVIDSTFPLAGYRRRLRADGARRPFREDRDQSGVRSGAHDGSRRPKRFNWHPRLDRGSRLARPGQCGAATLDPGSKAGVTGAVGSMPKLLV